MDHSQHVHMATQAATATADVASYFMPHGHCYLWTPSLVWINAGTDGIIFLSYLAISFLLTLTVIRVKEIPFQKIYLAFGLFIVACGFGHLMELLNIWHPYYWESAVVKLITATASLGTAIALPFYLPRIKELAQGAMLVKTQQALEESERRYQQLVQTTTDGVLMIDKTGAIEYANTQLCKLLQRSAEELYGRPVLEFIDEEVRGDVEAQIYAAKDNHQLQEIKFRRKDGAPLWFLASINKLKNEKNETTGLIGLFSDVTERRNAEEERTRILAEHAQELERNKQFLDSVIDNLPNMLFIKDAKDLRFLKFNKAGEKMHGIPRDSILGKNDYDMVSKDIADDFTQRDREVLASGGIKEFEERIVTKALGERYLHTKKVAMRGPDGEANFLLGISVDITDLKMTEQELIAAREQAIAATKVKSDFLANMSHEIRTPLNGIIGITDLLIDSGLTTAQEEYANIVKRSGDSLLHIINDILDFSKIEAGKMDLSFTEFSLEDLLKSSIEVFHFRVLEKHIELTSELDPTLPKLIAGDSVRLGQILLNLVGNAVKFTEGGRVSVSIKPDGMSGDQIRLRFNIQDSGIGISNEEQSRLFKPFTQADSSTARSFGGTGLGLSICKRLVNMMGGEIGVESQKNQGSNFWFTVLVQPARSKVEAAIKTHPIEIGPDVRAVHQPGQKLKVLVAEDNLINQMVTLAILKGAGYEAIAVPNGRAVVEEFLRNHYDLILMDCQMPEMDGYEATVRIRKFEKERGTHTPILALTANAMKSDEEKCRAHGMDDFLTKPIKKETLTEALLKWVSHIQTSQ